MPEKEANQLILDLAPAKRRLFPGTAPEGTATRRWPICFSKLSAAPRGLIECQSIVVAVGQGPIVYVSKRTPKRQL
jgi:hypothetical protein